MAYGACPTVGYAETRRQAAAFGTHMAESGVSVSVLRSEAFGDGCERVGGRCEACDRPSMRVARPWRTPGRPAIPARGRAGHVFRSVVVATPKKVTGRPAPGEERGTAASRSHARAKWGATAENVTDALREAILDGRIPASTWLREEDLAVELRVSRTPVREALRRLAADGLAVRVPNQGVQVTPMTIEDVLAVYTVRENLEGLAARLAANRADKPLIDELTRVHAAMAACAEADDPATMYPLNLEFHRIIRESSGNQYLERFLTLVEHAVRRFGATTYEIPGRMAATIEEHDRIITAIGGKDPDDAEKAARDHMRHTRDARIDAFVRLNT